MPETELLPVSVASPPTPVSPKDISGVFLDGVLVKLQVSYWTGRRTLKSEDLGLSADSVPDIFTLGSKIIVPKPTISIFGQIRAKADYALTQSSFPFPLSDARFVPYTALRKVMQAVEVQKARFETAVEDFLSRYVEYHQELIAQYPDHGEALGRAFLSPDSLKARFGFGVSLYSITIPRGMRSKAITASQARRRAQAEQSAVLTIQQEYEAQFRQQMDDFLGDSVKMLRERVVSAVRDATGKMENGDFTGRSLKSLRQTISSFRELNFMGDNAVEAALNNLENTIPLNAGDLSDGSVMAPFARALEVVEQASKGNRVAKVVERYGRKMMLE